MSAAEDDRPEQRARLLASLGGGDRLQINANDNARVRLMKRVVPHGLREPARIVLTDAVRPLARRRAARIATARPLRVNLGSGFVPVDGWTNLDLLGAPVTIPWNLRHGLPFADGSVDAVFSEHVFEHIPIAGAHALIRDSVRALRAGGVFRVAVPDAGALLRSYAATGDETWALSQPTRMQSVMSLFYENGHCTMYDAELLTALCAAAGLAEVRACDFGHSALGDAVPDNEGRRSGTLYVEGIKARSAASSAG